jgi:hypothetical protein
MVDQESDLAIGAVEGGHREVLAEGRPGDRQGVDRIGLAGLATRPAGTGHQLGWHADDALASDEEVGRQAPAEVAAVLQGERSVGEATRPADELEVAGAGGGHGLLGQLATGPVGGHDGVAALV